LPTGGLGQTADVGNDLSLGADWLGMVPAGDRHWQLPVSPGVTSGAQALFGGCATAAALVAAAPLVEQPLVWAAVHFGRLAPAGSSLEVRAEVLSAGRTLSHLAAVGQRDGTEAFSARIVAARRPTSTTEGSWCAAPDVVDPSESEPFHLPVHDDTWAARFEWRLPTRRGLAGRSAACWWVRPEESPTDPLVVLAVLADYVTYGVGRALGAPMGGLSIDNVLRIRRAELTDWLLVEVVPEAVTDGVGFGSAYVYDAGRHLLAVGSQSIVVNDWDWRTPAEEFRDRHS